MALKDRGQHSLRQSVNVIRPDERGLDVDLGEFGLAVGAQVFVAKAFCDLKILFHPADHEELLVLLRRLGESVEFARQDSAGDEEIARAFRCALGQDRRLHFDKALVIEIIARRLGDAVADAQVARQLRAAQVEVAIGQAQIFVAHLRLEREGKTFGMVQDRQACRQDLYLTRGEFRVFRSRQAGSDTTFDLDDVFIF